MPVIWISLGVWFLFLARKVQAMNRFWWKLAGIAFVFVGCTNFVELFFKDKMVERGFYVWFLLLNILIISLLVAGLLIVELAVRRNKRDSKNAQSV